MRGGVSLMELGMLRRGIVELLKAFMMRINKTL
jgi:hypothetical protein